MKCATKLALAAATAIVAQTSFSHAATIGTYAFNNTTDVPTATGVSFSQFTRTGVTAQSDNGRFSSSAFSTAGTIDTAEYVQFQVTANTGYQLTGNSLNFSHQRHDQNVNNLGPTDAAVRYSVNNFGSAGAKTYTPGTSATADTWNFTDFTIQNGESASFRFYGWNSATQNSARLSFDNVALLGDVQALARLNASSTSLPARIIKDGAASYTITTTNTAHSGGTVAAQTLSFDYGLQNAIGLSITSGESGSGIHRSGDGSPGNASTVVTVDTSSAGTKGGELIADSTNAYQTATPLPSFSVDVLDHSDGTLRHGSDIGDTLDITINAMLDDVVSEQIAIQNLIANMTLGAAFTAKLDYIGISETDNDNVFTNDLTDFDLLTAGEESLFNISLDTTSQGTFTGQYILTVGDEALAGAGLSQTLTINLTANVVPEPTSLGLLAAAGAMLGRRSRRAR